MSNNVCLFGVDQRSHFNCIKGRPRVFPFSQHPLQIYCKCYHSNYLLDKITGKNRFNGIIPRAVCGQNVKKNQTNTENDFGVTIIGRNSVIRIELIF